MILDFFQKIFFHHSFIEINKFKASLQTQSDFYFERQCVNPKTSLSLNIKWCMNARFLLSH